jgi:phosphoglycerol transferase MdoB-like AlkP superfamily enzyme
MAIETVRARDPFIWARILNFLLGVWLFISAFVWMHTAGERLNTWILGIWIAVFSLVAMSQPSARWLNTLAAIWLFFATLAIFHTQSGTLWNNLIVAVVVFILSFVGGAVTERRIGATTRRPVGV